MKRNILKIYVMNYRSTGMYLLQWCQMAVFNKKGHLTGQIPHVKKQNITVLEEGRHSNSSNE